MREPYPDIVARFYDTVYASLRDGVDNAWYLERMARAGGPVLEIGVGTGRLFAEARRRGIDAWGIDLSPSMIAACRAKLVPQDQHRVSVADAVGLGTSRRFAMACAPFRVLSHVHDAADQLRLLDAVHDCLLPGGAFIFDLYVPNLRFLLEGIPEHADFDGEYAPGRRLRRLVESAPADLSTQRNRVRMQFQWDDDHGRHADEWTFEMRFFFRFEVEHLVARSQLSIEAVYGDFADGELTADSRELVIVCRRPAA
jgi:SAM-dependent methyltransferase